MQNCTLHCVQCPVKFKHLYRASADLRVAHRRHPMRVCMLNDFDTRARVLLKIAFLSDRGKLSATRDVTLDEEELHDHIIILAALQKVN